MIGSNSIELNQATMVQAVQCWVDKTFQDPKPVVKSVKISADRSYTTASAFTVELESVTEKTDA